MKKKNISDCIDFFIAETEDRMNQLDKHIIKTETLKSRILNHIEIDGINEDSRYLMDVGFNWIVNIRLNAAGYRSVRTGMFVNLERCTDIEYLTALLDNVDTTLSEKEIVRNHISKLQKTQLNELRKTQLDGQIYFRTDGVVVVPINEDELMEKLERDAV